MSYTVTIKRSAEKEMDSLPGDIFDRVAEEILQLEADPRHRGCRKLRGSDGYRVRVGSYRILYAIDEEENRVEIMAVGHRRDVYRGR